MNLLVSYLKRVLRVLLIPLSLLYGLIIWLRNYVYDKGIYAGIQFSLPVISVGNLSTGGTGKTPHIEYLIRLLEYEYRLATMSRGYKRKTRGFLLADSDANAATIGDEPMQFRTKFPELIVSVCEERMTGIPELMRLRPETEVLLLDDAYQHRSVRPGLNILLTDFHRPFYSDFILPFGSLREGRSRSNRADLIVVTKCPPTLTEAAAQAIAERIGPLPHQQVFFSAIRYCPFQDFWTSDEIRLGQDASLLLVSGIAQSSALVSHLRSHTAQLHHLSYPDHHLFDLADLAEIKETLQNWPVENKSIVTTEKDAMRLRLHSDELRSWPVPIIVVPIEIVFLFQEREFQQVVRDYVEKEIEENAV